MNAALIFTVPEDMIAASQRCRQTVAQIGAPLKSDSGHYITGVVTSGHNNVEIRVTWLNDSAGTQLTVTSSHETLSEEELENVNQRFRYEYLRKTNLKPKSNFRVTAGSLLFAVGALAVIALFVFAIMKHKG
jgi:hypothetical protein